MKLGLTDEASGRVEIRAGLNAGDTVILARVAGLAAGQPVKLAAAPAAGH